MLKKMEERCDICKEKVRSSNKERHEIACRKGYRMQKRKFEYCEICKGEYKVLKKHQRICVGRIKKRVIYEECRICNNNVPKNNMRRHLNRCQQRYKIKRKK